MTDRFDGHTVFATYFTYATAAFAKRGNNGMVVMLGIASRCAKRVAKIDGTMHSANGIFSITRCRIVARSSRPNGQKSSSKSTKDVVTSIGFAIKPRARAAIESPYATRECLFTYSV